MLTNTKILIIAILIILFTGIFSGEAEAWPRHRVYYGYRPVKVVRVYRPIHRHVWVRGHYRVNAFGMIVWVPGHRIRV